MWESRINEKAGQFRSIKKNIDYISDPVLAVGAQEAPNILFPKEHNLRNKYLQEEAFGVDAAVFISKSILSGLKQFPDLELRVVNRWPM